jgi:hypothetical protein
MVPMAAAALDETFRRHEGDDTLRWLEAASPAPEVLVELDDADRPTALIAQCACLFQRAHLSDWFAK